MTSSNYDNKFWHFKHALSLLLLTLVCFWPLAFGIFSAKNDNIVQFLPTRFHVSEALRNGHLPLWTPYMYLGYPLHGDMQGGAWNPFVWIISIFGRYNIASLHCEILFYVFMAGVGMYRLLGAIGISPMLRLIGASAYLMSGYITDVAGSNLPFLAAAAYIPFIFAYYYHLLATCSWFYSLKTSVFLTLLFVSGYPSFFICTCYILLAAFVGVLIKTKIKGIKLDVTKLMSNQLLMVIFFLALSAPAIVSYSQILPFYQRGNGVSLNAALENSFHPNCSLSFLLPSVPVKLASTNMTDLISKNGYFNSLLLIFLLCYVWSKKTFFQNFILLGIISFFLFSLGNYTPVRKWCYELLPLMNTFRHPSNGRLFVIVGAIVLGITMYQNHLSGLLLPKYPRMLLLVIGSGILLLITLSISQVSIAQELNVLFQSGIGRRPGLKNFFDSLDYHDLVFLNGIIQIIFLGSWYILLDKKNWQVTLAGLCILNSFVLAQLHIPYTLVSKMDPKTINALITSYPSGYPKPDETKTISQNSRDGLDHLSEIGIESFYNKKIATVDLVYTPTFMTQMEKVMADSSLRNSALSHPYAFFDDKHPQASFQLIKFWNNSFQFNTVTNDSSVFNLQQLYLPGWKGFVDGKRANIQANSAFMAVRIPSGRHEIKFIYRPQALVVSVIVSLFSFLAAVFLLLKQDLNAIKR